MAGFRYQSRTDEEYQQRASGTGDFEGFVRSEFRLYRPHQGDNYIRFLPPTHENPKHYGIDVWVHYSVGPDEGAVICLQKMKNEPCPICEARLIADRRGDTDTADSLKPNKRVLVWLLDMKEHERDRKPLLWAMGGRVDTDFSAAAKDRETGKFRPVDHPDDGFNISFDRHGEKDRTRYSNIQVSSRPTAVPDDDLDYIMDHPLDTTLRWRDYDQLSQLFDGASRGRSRRDRDRPDDRTSRDREPARDARDDRSPPRDGGSRDRDDRDGRDRDRPDDRTSRDSDRRGNDRDRDPPRDETRRDTRDDRDAPSRSASSTSDELRRRWNTDPPRDEPRRDTRDDRERPDPRDASGGGRDRDPPRDETRRRRDV